VQRSKQVSRRPRNRQKRSRQPPTTHSSRRSRRRTRRKKPKKNKQTKRRSGQPKIRQLRRRRRMRRKQHRRRKKSAKTRTGSGTYTHGRLDIVNWAQKRRDRKRPGNRTPKRKSTSGNRATTSTRKRS